MEPKNQIKNLVIIAIYIGFGLMGVNIGRTIFRGYHAIADGVLGLTLFYLLYKAFLSPRTIQDLYEDNLIEFPKIKYFLLSAFWGLITYMAIRQISAMISFLRKIG